MGFRSAWRELRGRTPGELPRPAGHVQGSIFRRFLYLDFDMAINALAFIEGGVAEQVLEKTGFEVGAEGKLKAKNLLIGELELTANAGRHVERERTLKRTAHAVVGILIGRLSESGDLHAYPAVAELPTADSELVPSAPGGMPGMVGDRGREPTVRSWEEAALVGDRGVVGHGASGLPTENEVVLFSGTITPWPELRIVSAAAQTSFLARAWARLRGRPTSVSHVGDYQHLLARVDITDTQHAVLVLDRDGLSTDAPSVMRRRVTVIGPAEMVPNDTDVLWVDDCDGSTGWEMRIGTADDRDRAMVERVLRAPALRARKDASPDRVAMDEARRFVAPGTTAAAHTVAPLRGPVPSALFPWDPDTGEPVERTDDQAPAPAPMAPEDPHWPLGDAQKWFVVRPLVIYK